MDHSIYSLPLETLELIGSYLKPEDYHRLRVSFKNLLPKRQMMFPLRWLHIFFDYQNLPAECIGFHHDYITPYVFQQFGRLYNHYRTSSGYIWTYFHVLITTAIKKKVKCLEPKLVELGYEVFTRQGDRQALNALLQEMGLKSDSLENLFTTAWKYNDLEMVKVFLRYPNAPLIKTYHLELALENGHAELADLYLNKVPPPSQHFMAVAIASAARHDFCAMARVLLKHYGDKYSIVMLPWACRCGPVDIVQELLNDPIADPSVDENYAIRQASRNGHHEIVELLLKDPRVDPTAKENYPIRFASMNGHYETVKVLMNDSRVDPAIDRNIVIRLASKYGQIETVKLCLADSRVNPSNCKSQAFRDASRRGHLDVVKVLLQDQRVDPAACNNVAIRHACRTNAIHIAKFLLGDYRVDPSAHDNEAIRLSSAYGYIEVVKLLLKDSRVDPRAKDNEAVRLACENHHSEIVELLQSKALSQVSLNS